MKIRLQLAALVAAVLLAGCERSSQDALSVVISLPRSDAANVAKATLLVDYSGTGARIVSEGGGPSCAFILPGIDGDFADDRKGTLTIHTMGPRAVRGPADIVACRMQTSAPDVTAADVQEKISVRIAGAEDAAGKVIDVAVKAPGKASAKDRSEQDVEAEQVKAVKTAKAVAAAAPPPAATAPAGGPVGAAGAKSGMPAAAPAGAVGAPGAAARPAPVTPPRPTTSGAGVNVPGASSSAGNASDAGTDGDGAIVTNQDRDPGYDDSPSDDATVPAYWLEIAVAGGSGSFGALQFEMTHLGGSGGFIGRNDSIECVGLVDAIVAANYVGERIAKIGMISLQGIRMGSSIVRCGFRTREGLSPASFLVDVTDASDTNSKALDPLPTVVVTSVARR